VTLDALPPGPPSRFDKAATPRVQLDFGALLSVSDLALFSGANAAAIEHAPGRWEIIQFRDATLVAPATYALSTLIRGQQGTEGLSDMPLPAGARFVLLDSALMRLDLAPAEIGLPLNWRFGPSNRDIGAPSYDMAVHAFAGIGHRPFAPTHVRSHRDEDGLHISWIRRTRIGGDSWDGAEVPLGEASERYEIDVLDGDAVVRTLTASDPSTLYTAADQAADFGMPPVAITIRICQLSESHGRGNAVTAVL
jgi:hypothetical protein